MKWYEILALGFIGAMLYVYLKHRNANLPDSCIRYPSTQAPVAHDSLTLSLGYVHEVPVAPNYREIRPSPLNTENCAIMLAADYTCNVPAYAPAISPDNLGTCDPYINCWRLRAECACSDCAIGVEGPNLQPQPIGIPQRVSCNPNIPVCIPETGQL